MPLTFLYPAYSCYVVGAVTNFSFVVPGIKNVYMEVVY